MDSPTWTSTRKRLAVAEAQAQIDQQILELKARRNSLSPFMQLPIELIQRIISLHKHDDRTSRVVPLNRPTHSWVSITHVCRHLRAAALADHSLWTNVNCYETHWADELVRRSGELPLQLSTNFRQVRKAQGPALQEEHKCLQFLTKHFRRADFLFIDHFEVDLSPSGSRLSFLADTAPMLRSLDFYSHGDTNSLPHLSYTLFGGHAPNLFTLTLSNCVIYHETFAHHLCSLTTLKLIGVEFDMSKFEEPFPLFSMLSALPSLQKLSIRGVNYAELAEYGFLPRKTPLQMEQLEYFEIDPCSPHEALLILESMSPPKKGLRIDFDEVYLDEPWVRSPTLLRLLDYVCNFWNDVTKRESLSTKLALGIDGGRKRNDYKGFILTHCPPSSCYLEFLGDELFRGEPEMEEIFTYLSRRIVFTEFEGVSLKDVEIAYETGLLSTCRKVTLEQAKDQYINTNPLEDLIAYDLTGGNMKHLVIRADKPEPYLEDLSSWLKVLRLNNPALERIDIETDDGRVRESSWQLPKWRAFIPAVNVRPAMRR
jgi:hypothetical protein